ncbi:hypothetical protein VNO78_12988 [Psophocarpus tetragonolobus]|uniref:Uncharacterized protein n=1 Tax=Psophocarpus tetragonolobus TaxID=3891 RepID=A0AAN9SNP0_PSOTE
MASLWFRNLALYFKPIEDATGFISSLTNVTTSHDYEGNEFSTLLRVERERERAEEGSTQRSVLFCSVLSSQNQK